MKISQKLIIGFLSVALLVGIVGYISVQTSQKALKESIGQTSISLATQILDQIDRNIYKRIETFQEYSKHLTTQQAISKSNEEFEKLDNIQTYIDKKDCEWISSTKEEVTPFMQELISNILSEKLREKIDFYEENYGYKVFGEVFITNKYGANIAQTGKTTDYYQADEEWWQNAKKDGLYVADVEYDRSADVYSTDICIRIDDKAGNFLGVMKVVFNTEEIINIVKKAKAETTKDNSLEFILLTKNGKVIYVTYGPESFENISQDLLSHFNEAEKHKHKNYFISSGQNNQKKEVLFAHAHSKGYKDYKGLSWFLVAEYETEEIFAPVARLRKVVIIFTSAVTALAVILGLFITRSISYPVAKLCVSTAKIGLGDLDTRVDIKSNDEIGQLAAYFNKMAENLEQTTTSIDALNKEITERKKAEEEVNALNQQLEFILGATKTGIDIIDSEFNILYINAEWQKVYGEYKGKKCYEYFMDRSEVCPGCGIVKALKTKNPVVTEEVLAKEGERPIQVTTIPFQNEKEEWLVAEVNVDITERKQAEEEFKAIFDNAVDGILIADMESKRFYMGNNSICRMLGYGSEEIKDLGVMDIHPEKDLPYVISQFERQAKGDYHLAEDLPVKRKDGRVFYADVNATILKIAGKIYLMGFFHDTTERKKTEELILETNHQLQESTQQLFITKQELEKKNQALEKAREELENRVEERTAELVKANKTLQDIKANLHNMIKQNADGIIIVDSNEIVRFVNPAASSLFNRKPEEFIGETFGYPIAAGEATEIDIFYRDTKPITAEMHVAEIKWEGENVSLVSIRDVTERKLAEEKLKEANEQLTEYNRLKDEFVSTASHELRTPLSIIMGAIRLILDEIPGKIVEEQRDILATAMESVKRLSRIVDSLLIISKIESGKVVLHKTVVNLCELIKDTVSDCKSLAQEKELSLDYEVPEEGIDIYLDPDKIKEVLINLISNSLKFTPKGGWVKVICNKLDEEVQFSVQDSGIGVAKEDMPKLFDKFTQFGRKAGPGDKGTGLGLAIVKRLVEMHNGRIDVESEPNKGATFTISLPWTTEVEAEDLSAEKDEHVENTLANN